VATFEASPRQDLPPVVLRAPAIGCFRYDRLEPSPAVRDIVDDHWIVEWAVPEGEERVQDVITNPCAHLTAERDGSTVTVTGVVTRRFRRVLAGSGRVVGLRFRPAGFAALYGRPVSDLTDRALPAAEVLGAEAHEELARIGATEPLGEAVRGMEAFLERHRRPRPSAAVMVDAAVDLIVADRDITRVDQVADRFGVSARTLQRRFERYLGVGPKWVVQRRRIHDALAEIEKGRELDWCALALRLGYTDQAHFVHAFTELVGRAPSRYERMAPQPG
jgi:AraC-like DNA-binding protein